MTIGAPRVGTCHLLIAVRLLYKKGVLFGVISCAFNLPHDTTAPLS